MDALVPDPAILLDQVPWQAVALSLRVSLLAVLVASCLALPLGAWLALAEFPGRNGCVVLLNALMGLPPVAVGLMVYLLLSRAGPLGSLGILFTPTAMVIAQTCLIVPLIAALVHRTIDSGWQICREEFLSLGASGWQTAMTLLHEHRHALVTAVLAGFGRAVSEVGAVLIVGGNIDGVTRVITTTITLETAQGNLLRAVSLGVIVVLISLAASSAGLFLSSRGRRG